MAKEIMWRFDTANFSIVAYIEPEEYAPDFDDDEIVEEINNGTCEWFCTTVEVRKNDKVIGSDHLGGSAYYRPSEFFDAHRDRDPMHRNCSIFTAKNPNTVICHYFPDMVRQAIREARETLS